MKAGFLHRLDLSLRHLMPLVTVLLLLVVVVVPLRIPGLAAVMPWFPLIGVYYWSIYRPDLLPSSAVFLLGVVQDILANTPLGEMSFLYLMIRGLTVSQRRFFLGKPFYIEWCSFALVAAGGLLLEWLLSAALRGYLFPLLPQLVRFGLTFALYPVLSRVLSRLHALILHSA